MSTLRAIGADPGPIPGIVVLDFRDLVLRRVEVVQCSRGVAPALFRTLAAQGAAPDRILVQLERFVVGRRASRSRTAVAGEQTRELLGALIQAVDVDVVPAAGWRTRAAGEVKPWATDERLDAAGLLDATKGMRHARDGARHALFVAVKDGGIPDPLSRKAQTS